MQEEQDLIESLFFNNQKYIADVNQLIEDSMEPYLEE